MKMILKVIAAPFALVLALLTAVDCQVKLTHFFVES